jgi:hypothetical protein
MIDFYQMLHCGISLRIFIGYALYKCSMNYSVLVIKVCLTLMLNVKCQMLISVVNLPLRREDAQNVRRVLVLGIALLSETIKHLSTRLDEVLERTTRTALSGSISTLQRLRALVHQHPEIVARFVAVAVARHALDGNVREERQDLRRFPDASVVRAVKGHGGVDVRRLRGRGVVEQTQGNDNRGRKFAMRERDVNILRRIVG